MSRPSEVAGPGADAAPVRVADGLEPGFAAELEDALRSIRPTHALVDLDAIAANFAWLSERAGDASVLCVVKADAYGHGAVAVSRRLQREGARWLGVAIVEEAEELATAGISCRILLLGGAEEARLPRAIAAGATPSIVSEESHAALVALAGQLGKRLTCHLKVDTGMTRLGIPWQDFPAFVARLDPEGPLLIEGLFTHLASSDDPAVTFTREQLARFQECRDALMARGFARPLLHVASSAGLLTRAETDVEIVRPGVALYGLNPWGTLRDPMLTPAMALRSSVIRCADMPAGTPVGYGCTFIARRPSRFATIPAGYEDGLPRALGESWEVSIRGRLAPIVGRVSMDLIVADVTDIPGATTGDAVTLAGGGETSGALSLEEMARRLRTIPYEIACGISGRVPRVFLEGGRAVGMASRFGSLLGP